MASYHRVLETFGRSVHDNTLECDCDVHPWEVSINGEQWAGKLRLIGFVDVFFLISYSANARFEHGIIVYKDKLALEEMAGNIPNAGAGNHVVDGREEEEEPDENLDDAQDPNSEDPDTANEKASSNPTESRVNQAAEQTRTLGDKTDEESVAPAFRKTSTFSIQSLGHRVGLRASYPKSWIQSYKVEITKPATWALSSEFPLSPPISSSRRELTRGTTERIMRALKPHSTYDLMNDVIRCQIITQGQLAGHIMGVLLAGSRLDDTTQKYISGLTSGQGAGRQALSNEKI